MAKQYDLRKIYTLLAKGFTATELQQFCDQAAGFDAPLPADATRDDMVRLIFDYARNKSGFEPVLKWAHQQKPAKYDALYPYDDAPHTGEYLGKYRLVERLGRGGMADVHKAYHPALNRYVAIKALHGHLSDQTTLIERFQQEATAVAGLRHPNIVQVYDFFAVGDTYYMVMELIDGPTLQTKLRRHKSKNTFFSLTQTGNILSPLSSAIDYAHGRHMIHRDLKPSNIMFTAEGQVVLTDFGIARILGDTQHTVTGAVIGTPVYMSPEQAQGQRADARSDIYALGTILFEMVTGHTLFEGDTPIAIMMKHVNERPPHPGTINPHLPPGVEQVILKALNKNPDDRYQTAGAMATAFQTATGAANGNAGAISRPAGEATTHISMPKSEQRASIFISYKRNVDPDESVATKVYQALSKQHDVFIDQTTLVGERWAERIEAELSRADFLITFLSGQSIHSEMIEAEIAKAHRLAQKNGKPVILPVRLDYRDPFHYPLSAYLNALNWDFWQSHEDTKHVIKNLVEAITGNPLPLDDRGKVNLLLTASETATHTPPPSAQPTRLEMPEGTMDPQSKFYIERSGDRIGLDAIERQGVTITIKAPRQMGKSSLLMRIMDRAAQQGKRVAFLDFQLFDHDSLTDADAFFPQFCLWLTDELEMDEDISKYWRQPLGNSQRTTRYVSRHLLKSLDGPVLFAMDEVDSIFDTDFRSDFFGMLRSWHNSRRAGSIWKQFDLALVTSTEPYQLIENLNQSPFNVGEIIELTDFTPAQITDLNRRHGSPINAAAEEQLLALLGGHPYLTRRALYLVTSGRLTINTLFSHATDDHGPFGDHLRHHAFRLHGQPELVEGLRQVIHQNICPDERVFFRLRGAGLVRRAAGATVLPRCQLYANYFRERLDG